MLTNQPLQLFITGGTLDKQYQETTGDLVFPMTHLPQLLQEAHSTLDIKTQLLMQKDSLEMTDLDRKLISQACSDSEYQNIVITHGTDTMVETARLLLTQLTDEHLAVKTIVLT